MKTAVTLNPERAALWTAVLLGFMLFLPPDAFASGALTGGGSTAALPYETGVQAIWVSISQFVAPIAVALGVIVGMILFARGSAGAAIYSLFGFALIGGVALGITKVFSAFSWSGATIYPDPATHSFISSLLGGF